MRRTITTQLAATALGLILAGAAWADPVEDTLVIDTDDGELEIVTTAPAPDHLKDVMDTIWSGWHYREDETRDLQRDDFDNPAMVFADRGLDRWNAEIGANGESWPRATRARKPSRGCAPSCRGSMKRPAS